MLFQRPLIAIDIGSSAIKVLERANLKDKRIKKLGMELVPPGVIVDRIIRDTATVEAILKKLLKKLNIRTFGRRASISLGGSSVLIKRAKFPQKNDVELAELIEIEAEQHFQHDLNSLYFSWHPLEQNPDKEDCQILLAAAKKDLADQHIRAVKAVGLKIGVIDCDALALVNMLERTFGNTQGLIALANIGASATQVSIVGNGQYLYTRDISIGGDNYSKAIASVLNIPFEHAEGLKIAAGQQKDQNIPPEVHQAIQNINAQLVAEIQVTVDFFFRNGEAPPEFSAVNGLLLTGGGAVVAGLDKLLGSVLNIPVHVIDPLRSFQLPEKQAKDVYLGQHCLYGVAAGLATRMMGDHF